MCDRARSVAALLTIAITLPTAALAQSERSFVAGPIFAPGAELTELHSGLEVTEGAAVAPDGRVYFVDNNLTQGAGDPLGATFRFDPATGETEVVVSPNGQVNGQAFDGSGNLLMAMRAGFGARSLVRLDLGTMRAALVAGAYDGDRLNGLNDVMVAPDGTVFFTDPRFVGIEPIEQPHYGVYAVTGEGETVLVTPDVVKPNGIAVLPDGRTLYVSEYAVRHQNMLARPEDAPSPFGAMKVLAFDLDGTSVGAPRVLVDYGIGDGADGLLTDAVGYLYVAYRGEPDFGIRVYAPDGTEVAYLPTPEKPTNMAFGRGERAGTLYVTAGGSLLSVTTRQNGWVPATVP